MDAVTLQPPPDLGAMICFLQGAALGTVAGDPIEAVRLALLASVLRDASPPAAARAAQ